MNFDFRFYWSLFLRRLPAMVAVFLLCALIGVALAFKLPTTYASKARMLVETPQITGLQGTSTVSGAEQLEIIQNGLMTRANLIDIANDHRVFGRGHGMNPDQVVDAMRAATDISRSSGRNRATLMSVEFHAGNPRVAAGVVNDYVTLILEENARLQGNRTGNTLSFFSQEVDRLSAELNLQSEKILAFKQDHQDALPEGLNFRLNRESLLQERVGRTEREIAEVRDQRTRIISVFEATGRIQAPQRERRSPDEQKLASLRARLDGMLVTFSETNPRVKVLQSQIAQLEAQIAAQGGAAPQEDVSQEALLEVTLAQYDSRIDSLEQSHQDDLQSLDELRAAIEETGANEIALDALQRDYSNIQALYNSAIARRDQAQISQTANTSGLIGSIKVIEPATVPSSPSSPNRPLVAAGGVGVGLLGMAGLFMLLEVLNRTIRRPAELTRALGVTPMATIPYMQTRRHFWVRRTLKLTLLIAVIIAVPLALWAVDTYYSPLDLIYDRLLTRLGL